MHVIWYKGTFSLLTSVFYYSIDDVSEDFRDIMGYLEDISCGDIQGIYILYVFAYDVLVLQYTWYCIMVLLVF